jgi:SNF2 family DNA or RNA helicase
MPAWETWHEIKDSERMLVMMAFRPAVVAIRAIPEYREPLVALDLPLVRERRQPTVHVGLPMIHDALERLPDEARVLVKKHRPRWLPWVEQEKARQEKRNANTFPLASLSGHDGGATQLPLWGDQAAFLPRDLPEELYGYQRFGVQWLRLAHGLGVLGDDMGLGKTAQALAYLEGLAGPCRALFITPTSVAVNWQREAATWAPSLALSVVPSKRRLPKANEWLQGEERGGLVLTWGLLRTCVDALLDARFDTIVADEAHNLKELTSQRTAAFEHLALFCERRLLLTGTSVRNRPKELYPLLRLIDPLRFPVFRPYGERYCGPRDQHIGGGRTVRQYRGRSHVAELNVLSRPYLLRREKIHVLQDLPKKRRQTLRLAAPTARFAKEYRKAIEELRETEGADGGSALGKLGALRKKVGLAKVDAALDWIDQSLLNGEPAVVFVYHKDVHQALAEGLSTRTITDDNGKKRPVRFAAIVGGTPLKQRQAITDAFQAGDLDVLIGSEACKEGITLTRSAYTLHVEYWWTPGDMAQSEDRISRIGQTRPTLHVRLHLEDSLDDHVARLLSSKQQTIDTLMDRSPIDRLVLEQVLAVA